jgi:hypothetical protein
MAAEVVDILLRISANVDLYDVLNSSEALRENTAYGPVRPNPIAIMPGRFVKFGAQVSF